MYTINLGGKNMDKPFYLQFLEVLDSRYELPKKSLNRLKRERVGYYGHSQLDVILQPLVPYDWRLLHDLTFELNYGETQIDSLLLAPHGIYHFEIKNLLSEYEYREGHWYMKNGRVIRNYFTQLARQNEILTGLLRDFRINAPLESKLVLINEDDTVKFYEDKTKEYLKRGHIRAYLKEINQAGRMVIHPQEVAKLLYQKSISSYKNTKFAEQLYVQEARRGIICEKCLSNVEVTNRRYHLQCATCGMLEVKERAVLRTICDLGVLYYNQPLKRKMIMDFIGVAGIEDIVRRVLRKHFKMQPAGKLTTYENPVNRMEYAFPEVKFRYDEASRTNTTHQ